MWQTCPSFFHVDDVPLYPEISQSSFFQVEETDVEGMRLQYVDQLDKQRARRA